MTQTKPSIPDDEWNMLVKKYQKNKKVLRERYGVRSPTAFLRFLLREGLKKDYNVNE
jgi:hypothetical protein